MGELGKIGRTVAAALAILHGVGGLALAGSSGWSADGDRPVKRSARLAALRAAHKAAANLEEEYPAPYADLVVDANSRKILHADKADELRHPASLTKMMTLFLLFEALESGKVKLDTEFMVSEHATWMEPTKLGLKPGETLAVQDAILGLVVQSANDAAVVVAEALGGTESAFAERMTAKARSLGMVQTV